MSNETVYLGSTFLTPPMYQKWQDCCSKAVDCCLKYLRYDKRWENQSKYGTNKSDSCPVTWDGWSCWPQPADPGTVVEIECPDHIYWNDVWAPPCRGKEKHFVNIILIQLNYYHYWNHIHVIFSD